ncbi:MAG: S-layer protein [Candidatus Aenigmatarchaeota archaeon]
MKILTLLAKKQSYPKEIAKRLNVHEQKVYYHMRNMEKSGIIKIARKEEHGGAMAKIYALTKPSFFIRFKDFELANRIPRSGNCFLEPFIANGSLDAKIVVGSPDPHGPEKARARDISYAIELALFLGTFINNFNKSSTVFDTDMHEDDLKNNLILIGGPVTNKITRKINERLPVRFDDKKNIISTLSKRKYITDESGIIVKIKNPYDESKKILVIAGKRYSGTKAAILALLKNLDEIGKGNKHNKKIDAKVVEGLDSDYDGITDDVRILE